MNEPLFISLSSHGMAKRTADDADIVAVPPPTRVTITAPVVSPRSCPPRGDHPDVVFAEAFFDRIIRQKHSFLNKQNAFVNNDILSMVRAHFVIPTLLIHTLVAGCAVSTLSARGSWCLSERAITADAYDARWSTLLMGTTDNRPLCMAPWPKNGQLLSFVKNKYAYTDFPTADLCALSRRECAFDVFGDKEYHPVCGPSVRMHSGARGMLVDGLGDYRETGPTSMFIDVDQRRHPVHLPRQDEDLFDIHFAFDEHTNRFVIVHDFEVEYPPCLYLMDVGQDKWSPCTFDIPPDSRFGALSTLVGRPTGLLWDHDGHCIATQLDSRAGRWIEMAEWTDIGETFSFHGTVASNCTNELLVVTERHDVWKTWAYSVTANRWRREPNLTLPRFQAYTIVKSMAIMNE